MLQPGEIREIWTDVLGKIRMRPARGTGAIHAWKGGCKEAGRENEGHLQKARKNRKAGSYLRTGCVLNSEGELISPAPLPLMAVSRMAYLVSGFKPITVNTPSMLAIPEKRGNKRRNVLIYNRKWFISQSTTSGVQDLEREEHGRNGGRRGDLPSSPQQSRASVAFLMIKLICKL